LNDSIEFKQNFTPRDRSGADVDSIHDCTGPDNMRSLDNILENV